MKNDYYHLLNDFSDEDMELVRSFFWERVYPLHNLMGTNNIGHHQKLTYFSFGTTPKIKDFMKRYPMLSTSCVVNTMKPNQVLPIHFDGKPNVTCDRMCAINFPISGGNVDSPSLFYGKFEDYPSTFNESLSACSLDKNVTPIVKAQVSLVDKPALVNTKTWHNAITNGSETRVAFSWSCKYGISFDDARNMLLAQ